MATSLGIGGQIVTDGLILCLDAANKDSYPGSGTTWYDLSGNGNDGTMVNMDGTNFSLDDQGVLNFDGVNEYVNAGNISPTEMTWEFAKKWTTLSDDWILSNQKLDGSTAFGIEVRIDSPSYDFRARVGTGTSTITAATSIELNKWYIMSATCNSSNFKLYMNGSLVSSVSGTTIDYTDTVGLYIGARTDNTRNTPGPVSYVKFYNRALTASEVLNNYNATKSRFGL